MTLARMKAEERNDNMTRKVKKIVYNVAVGKPDVKPDAPSHVKGVREGNQPGSLEKEAGIHQIDQARAIADARRSTGISPEMENPVDPAMPNLPPA